MNTLKQYSLARIVQLLHPISAYDGWGINRRPPQVGDIGTIVEILHAPELPEKYIVESSDAEGISIWLGDFDREELESIDDRAYSQQHAAVRPLDAV